MREKKRGDKEGVRFLTFIISRELWLWKAKKKKRKKGRRKIGR